MEREIHISTVVLYSALSEYVPNFTNYILLPTNSEFAVLSMDIVNILNNNQLPTQPVLNLTIYTDPSGQDIFLSKTVNVINYSYAYDDVTNGTTTSFPGKINILFKDGTIFKLNDNSINYYWYTLNDLPIKPMT